MLGEARGVKIVRWYLLWNILISAVVSVGKSCGISGCKSWSNTWHCWQERKVADLVLGRYQLFLVMDCLGSFIFFSVRIGLVLKKFPLLNTLLGFAFSFPIYFKTASFTTRSYFIHTSVACAVDPSVTTFSTDFSFQNLVFWNLFEFLATEITSNSISLTFWIQILPNKCH